MLVLTERQAVAFDALMSLGTEGAIKAGQMGGRQGCRRSFTPPISRVSY